MDGKFKRLDDIEKRYNEINQSLSEERVYNNIELFAKLSKEKSELEEMVSTYANYKKISAEIRSNELLLEEEELKQLAREEIERLSVEKERLEQNLRALLLPVDPRDRRNVFLEIRAGTGGEEAALFAGDLFRMYARFCESRGWKIEIISESATDRGGLKEIIASVEGDRVYSYLKYESGVHRVQRVPVTEAQGRIHTSTVTVAVLPEAEDVEIEIDEKDLRVDVFRASGAGGQHVNRTESAVRITHIPSGIVVTCQDERSQHKNRARAMKILRARLYDMQIEQVEKQQKEERRSMVGTGERSEKIRTYNFPQNRVTDHRIGLTLHRLDWVLEGNLSDIIETLQAHFQAEALKRSAR